MNAILLFLLLSRLLLPSPGTARQAEPNESLRAIYVRLESRLEAAQAAHQWNDVAAVAQQTLAFLHSHGWARDDTRLLAAMGDSYLNRLQYRAAAGRYHQALALAGEDKPEHWDMWLTEAAYGLARIEAERGHFDKAIGWIERYKVGTGSGCVDCQDRRAQYAEALRTVWQIAQLPHEQASHQLRLIQNGEWTPHNPMDKGMDAKEWKQTAAQEAAFIQAELLLRAGEQKEARKQYFQVVESNGALSSLAQAHLKTIEQTAPML